MPKTSETKKTDSKPVKITAAKPAVKRVSVTTKTIEEKPVVVAAVETAVNEGVDSGAKKKPEKYYEAIGRRKTAVARVRLYTKGDKVFLINDKPFEQYFIPIQFKNIVEAPLVKMNCTDRFRITARVSGGGTISQAEALRHGITRALVMFNADFKKRLKKSGYLTRDPRMKERKKPGLKKARRAPQWAKR